MIRKPLNVVITVITVEVNNKFKAINWEPFYSMRFDEKCKWRLESFQNNFKYLRWKSSDGDQKNTLVINDDTKLEMKNKGDLFIIETQITNEQTKKYWKRTLLKSWFVLQKVITAKKLFANLQICATNSRRV